MKILEINKFYFPKRGAERHFMDVIDLLESRGHEVAVFAMNHSHSNDTPWKKYFLSSVGYTDEFSWLEKIKGACRMFYSFEAKAKINALLDDFKPDVVHVHNIYHQLSPAFLFEIKKRKIPVVMTVHDFKVVCPNHSLFLNGKFYERCKGNRFYECFLDKCVKNSYAKSFLAMLEAYWHNWLGTYEKNVDVFIVPSVFVKKTLIERGIEEKKIKVLPHFMVAAEIFSDKKEEDKMHEQYVLYAGAISKEKGLESLCKIFESISNGKLYIAGNMENVSVSDLEKFPNVKYLGFLNKAALSGAMKKAKCIVSGSKLPETFGLAALEALSFGKPFFGFVSGAYAEIIRNRENGFLANNEKSLKEELEKFLDGKILYDSEKIRKEAEKKYGKNAYAEKLEDVFTSAKRH